MHIVKYARNPLYKNFLFIMLSSITNAGFGFFFWMPAEDVKKLENTYIEGG